MSDKINYSKIAKPEQEEIMATSQPPVGEKEEAPTHKVVRVVKCKRLNVRSQPSKTADVICVVEEGFNLSMNIKANMGIAPGWVRVRADADKVGYVMGEFVAEV